MILAVINDKGGTGKSTSAVNLAAALVVKGKKGLLVERGALWTKGDNRCKTFHP